VSELLVALGAFFGNGVNHYDDSTDIISQCVPQIMLEIIPRQSFNATATVEYLDGTFFPAVDRCINWTLCKRAILTWRSHTKIDSYGDDTFLFLSNGSKFYYFKIFDKILPNNFRISNFCGFKEMPFYKSDSGFPACSAILEAMEAETDAVVSLGPCSILNLPFHDFIPDFVDFFAAHDTYLNICKAKKFSGVYCTQSFCLDFNNHEGGFSLTNFHSRLTSRIINTISVNYLDTPSEDRYYPDDDAWNKESIVTIQRGHEIEGLRFAFLLGCQLTKLGIIQIKQNSVQGILHVYISIFASTRVLLKAKCCAYDYLPGKYTIVLEIYYQLIYFMIHGYFEIDQAQTLLESLNAFEHLKNDNFACLPSQTNGILLKDINMGHAINLSKITVISFSHASFKNQIYFENAFDTLLSSGFKQKCDPSLDELILKELAALFGEQESIDNLTFAEDAGEILTQNSRVDWIDRFLQYIFSERDIFSSSPPFFKFWFGLINWHSQLLGRESIFNLKKHLKTSLLVSFTRHSILWMPEVLDNGLSLTTKVKLSKPKELQLNRPVFTEKDCLKCLLNDSTCLSINKLFISACEKTPLWQYDDIRNFATSPSHLILKLELLIVAFLEIDTRLFSSESKFWTQLQAKLADVICAYFTFPHYTSASGRRIQIEQLKRVLQNVGLTKARFNSYTSVYEALVTKSINDDDTTLSNINQYLRIPNYSRQRFREFWYTLKMYINK
jgi:hypothetical protein